MEGRQVAGPGELCVLYPAPAGGPEGQEKGHVERSVQQMQYLFLIPTIRKSKVILPGLVLEVVNFRECRVKLIL